MHGTYAVSRQRERNTSTGHIRSDGEGVGDPGHQAQFVDASGVGSAPRLEDAREKVRPRRAGPRRASRSSGVRCALLGRRLTAREQPDNQRIEDSAKQSERHVNDDSNSSDDPGKVPVALKNAEDEHEDRDHADLRAR